MCLASHGVHHLILCMLLPCMYAFCMHVALEIHNSQQITSNNFIWNNVVYIQWINAAMFLTYEQLMLRNSRCSVIRVMIIP